MTVLETLQSVMYETYTDESGETFTMSLLPSLTEREINTFASELPSARLPAGIRELLSFTSGIIAPEFGGISFTRRTTGLAASFFPMGIELMNDGLGNSWIIDTDDTNSWGPVYYLCRQPAVLILQSTDLASFILLLDDFYRNGPSSGIHFTYENEVWRIWNESPPLATGKNFVADETVIKFCQMHQDRIILDMRKAQPGMGLAPGRDGDPGQLISRLENFPVWAIARKEKSGFFRRLFSR